MRKFLPIFTLLLLILGGVFFWRVTHPTLSDEQQIAANLNAICQAAKNRSPRGITDYLAKDFKSNGVGKKDFQNSLVAGILQYRVIDLKVSGVKTSVLRESLGEGVTAESKGRFVLSLKSEFDSPPQITRSQFDLTWRKIEGEWKIVAADVPDVAQLSN